MKRPAIALLLVSLALGVVIAASSTASLHREPLGSVRFVFAVAPHHPLAHARAHPGLLFDSEALVRSERLEDRHPALGAEVFLIERLAK